MLEVRDISKSYTTANFTQKALDQVSIRFQPGEFVSILGASGSGKTTLLNIMSGLDRYDDGDLVINGQSTKKFSDGDWDAYRNNSVGFIFQSYNLITHVSVLANVEMGLTLSGVGKDERREKAMAALRRVGLEDHAAKRPNQLSGGQMQRVAIARALVNSPDFILCDEPTGALDSTTSVQIMELIKEIAAEKLVIMVTHNPELAHEYSDRIIELRDGVVISDTKPADRDTVDNTYRLKTTAMKFPTALSLSWNNIRTKFGRTSLTAFAASIGIIGITTVLALSNGFQHQIDDFESTTMGSFPITVNRQAMVVDPERFARLADAERTEDAISPFDMNELDIIHVNNISDEFIDHLAAIDDSLVSGIGFNQTLNLNLLSDGAFVQSARLGFDSLPQSADLDRYLASHFDLLAGSTPQTSTDLLVMLDEHNQLDVGILTALGLDTDGPVAFDDVIGKTFHLVSNDDFFVPTGEMFVPGSDTAAMQYSPDTVELQIVGVVRPTEDSGMAAGNLATMTDANAMASMMVTGGILYRQDLADQVIALNADSAVVTAQHHASINVLTGESLAPGEDTQALVGFLGGVRNLSALNIFPTNFEAKDAIVGHIEAFNDAQTDPENLIEYTDLAGIFVSMSSGIMGAITNVLISFSAVSLLVSGIMIGIITYISVLERTKEIGILRSLGARKKDITRVFNAETTIVGLASGLLGVGVAYAMTFPINHVLEGITGLSGVSVLNPWHGLGMVAVALAITLIGGFLPAKMAARKDPVAALRSE